MVFIVQSKISDQTNAKYGTYFELRLDVNDANNSYVNITADDSKEVSNVFHSIKEILDKQKSKSWLFQNAWFQLLVQVFGVIFGFLFSFMAASKLSPFIIIENSFEISLIFIFLIFSNTWGFILQQIYRVFNYGFPSIRLHRQGKDKKQWAVQTLIGSGCLTLIGLLLTDVFKWIGSNLGQYIAP